MSWRYALQKISLMQYSNQFHFASFEVFTALTMKNSIFCLPAFLAYSLIRRGRLYVPKKKKSINFYQSTCHHIPEESVLLISFHWAFLVGGENINLHLLCQLASQCYANMNITSFISESVLCNYISSKKSLFSYCPRHFRHTWILKARHEGKELWWWILNWCIIMDPKNGKYTKFIHFPFLGSIIVHQFSFHHHSSFLSCHAFSFHVCSESNNCLSMKRCTRGDDLEEKHAEVNRQAPLYDTKGFNCRDNMKICPCQCPWAWSTETSYTS